MLWLLSGVFWCFTVVGIPIGKQCFKIAKLSFCPFRKEVVYCGGTASFLLNFIWVSFTGWALAIEAIFIGIIFCIFIVGMSLFNEEKFKELTETSKKDSKISVMV